MFLTVSLLWHCYLTLQCAWIWMSCQMYLISVTGCCMSQRKLFNQESVVLLLSGFSTIFLFVSFLDLARWHHCISVGSERFPLQSLLKNFSISIWKKFNISDFFSLVFVIMLHQFCISDGFTKDYIHKFTCKSIPTNNRPLSSALENHFILEKKQRKKHVCNQFLGLIMSFTQSEHWFTCCLFSFPT